jgi:gliding motility-associated-like protein
MRGLVLIVTLLLYNILHSQNVETYRIVAIQNLNENIMSISNTVSVEKPLTLYAPNAFSPNGDGVNDHFQIKGQGVEDYNLEIYNRWGQMVFQSENINTRWNGEYRGKQAPIGTYVYQVKGINVSGNKIIVKDGFVVLVR